MNSLQIIAERIKRICDNRGITINKMLSESLAGERTYHNMLSGSYPSIDKIDKIATYLNCSIDYLLGRDFYTEEENKYLCEKLIDFLNNRESGLNMMFGTFTELPKDILESIRNKTHKFTSDEVKYFSEVCHKDLNELLYKKFNSKLSDTELKLLNYFRSLSEYGKIKAIDYVSDLSDNDKYTTAIEHIAAEEKISTKPIVNKKPRKS